MMQGERKYWWLLGGLLAVVVIIELIKPQPVDWRESYAANDARPLGGDVLRTVLPSLFPGHPVVDVEAAPYQHLVDTTLHSSNYVFVTDAFAPDEAETVRLLNYVGRGNHVYIAAGELSGLFADTLAFENDRFVFSSLALPGMPSDTVSITYRLPGRAARTFTYTEGTYRGYGLSYDSTRTTVLGVDADGDPFFMHMAWGEGAIWVHLQPETLGNVNLLEGDRLEALSYAFSPLPNQPTFWDEHHKPMRAQVNTPLRFVLRHDALRPAYWTIILAVLVVLVVGSKRRTRPVPVVIPPPNDSLDFVQTVGRLYHETGQHQAVLRKRVAYLHSVIRERYRLRVPDAPDVGWLERLAARSGQSVADVTELFQQIRQGTGSTRLSEEQLKTLSASIDHFLDLAHA
ncbi:MAG: hypothetical protein RhofKO_05860 [Rhodothermales bacterium]